MPYFSKPQLIIEFKIHLYDPDTIEIELVKKYFVQQQK